MKRKSFLEFARIPFLGLVSATCGILVAAQVPASAAGTHSWGVQRIMKDATSVVAAGVGASVSALTYVPSSVSLGPTVASGVAGSVGFAAGGATKIAGDYIVSHPKTSLQTLAGSLMIGDLTALPSNVKALTKNFAHWLSR